MPILSPAPRSVYIEDEALADLAIDILAAEAAAEELGLEFYGAVRDQCIATLQKRGYPTWAAYAAEHPEAVRKGLFSFGGLYLYIAMLVQALE